MKRRTHQIRCMFASCFGVACLLLMEGAFAAPTAADKDRAGALLDKGDVLLEKGDLEEALKAYREADEIMRVPTTRLPVARVLEKMGRLAEAMETALEVVRMPTTTGEPYAFVRAREEAQSLASRLDARVPALAVKVTGVPADVTPKVELDTVPLSPEDFSRPLRLDPGRYRVAASAPGFTERSEAVVLSEGQRESVELALDPLFVDTAPVSSAPASESSVPTLAYVGFGVGAVGVVSGGITGWMTISKSKDIEAACGGKTCPSSYESDLDSAQTMGWVSNVSFGIAAAGVVVGVAALLAGDDPEVEQAGRRPAPALTPVLGFGQVGMAGSF